MPNNTGAATEDDVFQDIDSDAKAGLKPTLDARATKAANRTALKISYVRPYDLGKGSTGSGK